MSGLMGGFYRISEWVMRIVVTNLLWLFFNLPTIYFTFNILLAQEYFFEALFVNMIAIGILSPFILFPATAAAFSVVRKWVMGDLDVPLLKTFLRGFKSNYKMSMFGGFVLVPLWALFVFDYFYYVNAVSSVLNYVFIVLGVILLAITINFFSMTVHFHMKFWTLLKNAALITVGRPLISAGIVIVTFALVYLSIAVFTWMIPFCAVSLIAYFSFRGFYIIYSKVQEIKEQEEEKRLLEEPESEELGTDEMVTDPK